MTKHEFLTRLSKFIEQPGQVPGGCPGEPHFKFYIQFKDRARSWMGFHYDGFRKNTACAWCTELFETDGGCPCNYMGCAEAIERAQQLLEETGYA